MSRSRRSSEDLGYFLRSSSACSGLKVASMAAALGRAWLSLSLRLAGCWSSKDEDEEVVLKSSGAAVPLPLTSVYEPNPGPVPVLSLTPAAPTEGGVSV